MAASVNYALFTQTFVCQNRCVPKKKRTTNTGEPYERAAEAFFRKKYPGCKVEHDAKVVGLRATEQIDILVTIQVGDEEVRFAIEAKDHKRRLDKDRFAPIELKFKSIKANIGIVLCSNGVQSGFKERLDSSELDMKLKVLSLEQLIEGSWADEYLEAVEEVKAAKQSSEVSPELEQKTILTIENRPDLARIFFHELENPIWTSILAKSGVFEKCLAGKSKLNSNLLCDFVCKHAKVDEASFLQFARAFKPPNGWIEDDLIRTSLTLTAKSRHEFIKIAAKWREFSIHSTDEVCALVISECRSGHVKEALLLLSRLTAVKAVEEASMFGGKTYYLNTPLNDHWFNDLTLSLFPKLSAEFPQHGLPYSRTRMEEAILGKYPDYDGDLPSWVCRHVSNEEEYGPRDTLDSLVHAYRDSLMAVPDELASDLRSECIEVLSGGSIGSVRCVLHVITERFGLLGDLFDMVYSKHDWWNNYSTEPEMESLVEKNWHNLTVDQQELICDLLLNLPARTYARPVDSEELEKRRRINIVQWLAILRELELPESKIQIVESVYLEYAADTGVTKRELREGVKTVFVNDVADIAEEFTNLQAREVLENCLAFIPHSVGYHDKTPHGLATKLEEEVSIRPREFTSEPSLIAALPYQAYMSSIIKGLGKACRGGLIVPRDCTDVIRNILELAKGEDGPGDTFDNGKRTWTRLEAARFVREAVSGTSEDNALSDLNSLFQLWNECVKVSVNDLDEQGLMRLSYVDQALNSTGGELSLGLAALAAKLLHRLQDEKISLVERQGLQDLRVCVTQSIKDFALASPNPIVRCPIGRIIPELITWEQRIIEDHVDDWFPEDSPELGLALLESYYSRGPRYIEVFRLLREKYLSVCQLLGNPEVRGRWCEGFSVELVLFWWRGDLSDNDPLVLSFARYATTDDIEAAIYWTGQRLKSVEAEEWKKAIYYWKLLLNLRPEEASKALGRIYYYFERLPDSILISDISDVFAKANTGSELHLPEQALRVLVRRSNTEQLAVANLILSLATANLKWVATYVVKHLKEAAQICFVTGNEDVKEVVREIKRAMLRRGILGFDDLNVR